MPVISITPDAYAAWRSLISATLSVNTAIKKSLVDLQSLEITPGIPKGNGYYRVVIVMDRRYAAGDPAGVVRAKPKGIPYVCNVGVQV